MSPHQNDCHQENKEQMLVMMQEEKEPIYTLGSSTANMKICMEVPQKLKMSNHMTQLSHS
jgi:hypothetical protein